MPIKLNGETIFNENNFVAKSNATHYAMPNYSAGQTYEKGIDITVPSDGLFIFVQDTGNYATASYTIYDPQGNQVAYAFFRNHNDSNTAVVPVPKDYKIKFEATYNCTITFYPYFTS